MSSQVKRWFAVLLFCSHLCVSVMACDDASCFGSTCDALFLAFGYTCAFLQGICDCAGCGLSPGCPPSRFLPPPLRPPLPPAWPPSPPVPPAPPSAPPPPPLPPNFVRTPEQLAAALGDPAIPLITLVAGTYALDSALVVDRNVTLAAELPGTVLLDGHGVTSVLELSAALVNLNGLTVVNGQASEGVGGGGIRIVDATVQISNCSVSGCASIAGGGIYSRGSALSVDNTAIYDNTAALAGSGVYARQSVLTFLESNISANVLTARDFQSAFGCGLYVFDSDCSMLGSFLVGNSFSGQVICFGGGLYADAIKLKMVGCHVASNNGITQGAGILLQDVQAHLESCDINKNELSSFLGVAIGAGLHVSNGRASLYKCQIHSHDNDEGQGGGLALRYGAHADLVSCNIFSNVFREEAASWGGGIFVSGAQITSSGGILPSLDTRLRCEACNITGCNAALGGGVRVYSASVELLDSTISNCSADLFGGGISSQLFSDIESIELHQCLIFFNLALGGGGIYFEGSKFIIRSCHVRKNKAGSTGGGVQLSTLESSFLPNTFLTIENCSIDENEALQGGGVHLFASPVNSSISQDQFYAHITAIDSNITSNRATVRGAGILIRSSSMTMSNCLIAGNTAASGGGLAAVSGNVLMSNGTIFERNTAGVGKGSTILVEVAVVVYQLPVPDGHYVSASPCEAVFIGCPEDIPGSTNPCPRGCGAGNLSLAPLSSAPDPLDCGERAPFVNQPCPWDSRLDPNALGTDILGSLLQTVYAGSLDFVTWPIPCTPGILGATADNLQGQTTSFCSGFCEAGFYCPSDATTNPTLCPLGHFCPSGSSSTRPCPAGSYANETGLALESECLNCPLGSACSTGSIRPELCSPGTYSNVTRQRVCSPCEAGTFQDEEGKTACKACERGSFCKGGTAPPLPCESGTFSGATDLSKKSQCSLCPPGSRCSTGSTTPTPCAPGTVQPEPGRAECEPCPGGSFRVDSNGTSCEECPRGSYCPEGASNPIGCESGAGIAFAETRAPRSRGPEACVCEAGYYNTSATCAVCPSGTDCLAPGITLETLPVRPGYYRLSNKSVDVRRCPDALADCIDSTECATNSSGCAGELRLDLLMRGCHDGLEGTYCLLCTRYEGSRIYYSAASSSERAQCKECPDAVLNTILIALGSVVGVAVVGWGLSFVHRQLSLQTRQWLGQAWHNFSLTVKLKILVGFYMIAGAVGSVYEVNLPPEARRLLNFFSAVISLGFDEVDALLECLNFHGYVARLATYMLTPVLITTVILLLSAVYFRADVGVQMNCNRILTMYFQRASPFLLQLVFLAYPLVTRVAFSGFSCYEFTDSAWLKADVAIQCYTSQHHAAQALAVVAICIYPVGLLVLNGALLFRARHAIRSEKSSPLSHAIAFLHREYEPHFFWWELVEMLRRFVLVGLMVLYQDTMLQLILATLLCALFLLLQVQASPYRRKEDNFLASVASFCLLVVFLCATAFKYLSLTNLEDIQDKMSIEQRRVYVVGDGALLGILIASSIVTLACSVGIFLVQLAAARLQLLGEEELAVLTREVVRVSEGRSSSSVLFASFPVAKAKRYLAQLRRVTVTASPQAREDFSTKGKFATNTLITGKPEEAAFGLLHYMGVPDPFGLAADGVDKIRAEVEQFVQTVQMLDKDSPMLESLMNFAYVNSGIRNGEERTQIVTDVRDWLDYVLQQPTSEKEYLNGIRDAGRDSVYFTYFANHEMARMAKLQPAHVLALRLYTTHIFSYMNGPLRSDDYGDGKWPHPLPITMTFISEGIKKLRAVHATGEHATKVTYLWRGMKNLRVAAEFMTDLRGGTEVAPMSTTTKLHVAAKYGVSDNSLLFKIKVSNFLQHGADLQWLSAFPDEAEVCYPPLTYLQPTGREQVVSVRGKRFKVCEVVPHIP